MIKEIERDIQKMTANQLRVAKANYIQEEKRIERKSLILNATITDKHHPDILQAEHKHSEIKKVISMINTEIQNRGNE